MIHLPRVSVKGSEQPVRPLTATRIAAGHAPELGSNPFRACPHLGEGIPGHPVNMPSLTPTSDGDAAGDDASGATDDGADAPDDTENELDHASFFLSP